MTVSLVFEPAVTAARPQHAFTRRSPTACTSHAAHNIGEVRSEGGIEQQQPRLLTRCQQLGQFLVEGRARKFDRLLGGANVADRYLQRRDPIQSPRRWTGCDSAKAAARTARWMSITRWPAGSPETHRGCAVGVIPDSHRVTSARAVPVRRRR